jgi:hypothetical protein
MNANRKLSLADVLRDLSFDTISCLSYFAGAQRGFAVEPWGVGIQFCSFLPKLWNTTQRVHREMIPYEDYFAAGHVELYRAGQQEFQPARIGEWTEASFHKTASLASYYSTYTLVAKLLKECGCDEDELVCPPVQKMEAAFKARSRVFVEWAHSFGPVDEGIGAWLKMELSQALLISNVMPPSALFKPISRSVAVVNEAKRLCPICGAKMRATSTQGRTQYLKCTQCLRTGKATRTA